MGLFRGMVLSLILGALCLQGADPSCAQRLLGSHLDSAAKTLGFRLFSQNAERVEIFLFAKANDSEPLLSGLLSGDPNAPGIWTASFPFSRLQQADLLGASGRYDRPIYYGYRLWGPNWPYSSEWVAGSERGFLSDADLSGNRFNPNKLVADPYAKELSHEALQSSVFLTGDRFRALDSSKVAPKGVVVPEPRLSLARTPTRPFRKEVIYELHVKGFTKLDPSLPEEFRGTYRGVGHKAKYLRALGITAVELMPVHEFNAQENYWGYMTQNYFAPEKSYATYASQQKPGGVIEEFQQMVEALHQEGIKVYLDVVFNHTGEEVKDSRRQEAQIMSFRGIDNSVYYQSAGSSYADNSGCGPNLNCAHPTVRNLILDSKKYWRRVFRVDGFRDDLASVLGNVHSSGLDFQFDKMPKDNILNRAITELPARPAEGGDGVDLIAEPWACGSGTYQLGNFPFHKDKRAGWAEWNGAYRDDIRKSLVGHSVTPGRIAHRLSGSRESFENNGRKPWHSVNFVTAHDGFTLWDLFSYDHPNNMQAPPYGPSPGGETNNFSKNLERPGDSAQQAYARRKQAARTAMAVNLLALGVPMMVAGDEFLRTQRGNNNPWNLDAEGSWVDWTLPEQNRDFLLFTQALLTFRNANEVFMAAEYPQGNSVRGDGVRDLAWYQANGKSAEDRDLPTAKKGFMDDYSQTFLGWRLDNMGTGGSSAASFYLGYNWGAESKTLVLPTPRHGHRWFWVGDTHADFESPGNFVGVERAFLTSSHPYEMKGHALAVFVEKRVLK
jgi:isoamylase